MTSAARPGPTPLDELVRHAAGGDPVAFAQVCAQITPRIHLVAARVLRDPHHAQEVTQEVLTEMWRALDGYDPTRGTALGWVLTMAHHRAVDRVRHESAARRRHATYESRTRATPFDETSMSGLARVECAAVRVALLGIAPLQRQVIELAYFDGLSHAQVAVRLEVPLGTVKSRIRDGLRKMREALPELEPEAA